MILKIQFIWYAIIDLHSMIFILNFDLNMLVTYILAQSEINNLNGSKAMTQ